MTGDAGSVDALKRSVSGWASAVHSTAVATMPDQIRGYAPIKTGELRESIHVDNAGGSGYSDSSFTARIVADVIQARTTDQGSPPHMIRATRAHGLLVFEIGGQTIFTSRPVHHPGNAPRPWWERALRATWEPNLRYAALHTPMT